MKYLETYRLLSSTSNNQLQSKIKNILGPNVITIPSLSTHWDTTMRVNFIFLFPSTLSSMFGYNLGYPLLNKVYSFYIPSENLLI